MFYWRRVYFLVVMLIIIIAMSTVTVVAQDPELVEDAKIYASDVGIDLDEAVRRLQLQDSAGKLNDELTAKEQDTFAGLWIQHKPEFRIIVQFTRDGEKTVQPYIEKGPLADIIEVRSAKVTLAELETIQTTGLPIISKLGIPVDSGINVFENRVEIYVVERERLDDALRKANIQLPDSVTVIKVDQLSSETANIYAGLSLSSCTSGFSVRNSSGTKGILTAGHCSNSISYSGTNLPIQSEAYYGAYDVQWHTAPGFTVKNWAYDGIAGGTTPNYRTITASKNRANQAINEFVCKYGKVTAYGCGYIIDKNFQPNYVPNGLPTFMRVHRDGVDLCEGGDSGGPWYSGSTAYGIMSGQLTNDAIYMAINYISQVGVDVLTQ